MEDKFEKCSFPGCEKMLKLPPWEIVPGTIQCLDHTRGQNPMADTMVDVLQGKQPEPATNTPVFRSWKDEFKVEDVAAFLKDDFPDWTCDGIAGDGDVLLKSKEGPLAIASLVELKLLKQQFEAETLMVEAYAGDAGNPYLLVTLSWNL